MEGDAGINDHHQKIKVERAPYRGERAFFQADLGQFHGQDLSAGIEQGQDKNEERDFPEQSPIHLDSEKERPADADGGRDMQGKNIPGLTDAKGDTDQGQAQSRHGG